MTVESLNRMLHILLLPALARTGTPLMLLAVLTALNPSPSHASSSDQTLDTDLDLFDPDLNPGPTPTDLSTPSPGYDEPMSTQKGEDTVPRWYKDFLNSGYFYAMGVVIPAGLLCNFFSICIFTLSKSLRRTTTAHYLTALACADSVFLLGELKNLQCFG